MSEQEVMLVHGDHAADRLLRSQKLEPGSPYLCGAEPPSPSQVAAVLHALGDHTLLMHLVGDEVKALGDDRGHLGYRWQHATGLGRFFQRMGSWLEYRDRLGNPRQSAVEAPSGDEHAEEAPGAVRGAGSASGAVSRRRVIAETLTEHEAVRTTDGELVECGASYGLCWRPSPEDRLDDGGEAAYLVHLAAAISAAINESASGAREGGKA